MSSDQRFFSPDQFNQRLYTIIQRLCPAVEKLELYEFQYCLNNYFPQTGGWKSVAIHTKNELEELIKQRDFFNAVKLKPVGGDKILLDESITRLTRMLFVGLVNGAYPEDWVHRLFYFDLRGFIFLVRTQYFTEEAIFHLQGKPLYQFGKKQVLFESVQDISYKDFKALNAEVDQKFIEIVKKIISITGTPILLTLAGPTAAGKTEISARLFDVFIEKGQSINTIEMDSFLLDSDYRDNNGIKTLGIEAYHFDLFMSTLHNLLKGEKTFIPTYDSTISSHDRHGILKPGQQPKAVEPSDIIIIEGNFPFQIKEVSDLIGIKIVYLTDDPVRLKRKWKRDIDYHKKYDTNYFLNRFFRTQFLRAQDIYQPQLQVCDLLVDTTQAAIWASKEVKLMLSEQTR